MIIGPGERTFQLLTQAVGRAGRGEKAGEAVIQTYSPEHYSDCRRRQPRIMKDFMSRKCYYREMMGYPPV